MATAIQKALYGESPLSKYKPLTAPSLRVSGSSGAPTQPVGQGAGSGVAPLLAPQGTASQGSDLASFGYNGPLGLNDYEQQYLNQIAKVTGDQTALNGLDPAADYYNRVLNGEFGAEGSSYLQDVLDPMKASMMQEYDELSKALATRFSNVGAYYGGKSGVAQGRLASDTTRNMANQEAQLRYQRYNDNMGLMGDAAYGLRGIAGERAGLENNYLAQLLGGGNLITGREQYNQDQYQGAMDRSYQDWTRARAEQLLPWQIAQGLLGVNSFDNIVTQDPGALNAFLGATGNVVGSYLGRK